MKLTILAAAILACTIAPGVSSAADCVNVADGFTTAADMGRRGTPLAELTQYLSKNDSEYTDDQRAGTRMIFIQAYQMGANGEAMSDVWQYFYDQCKATEQPARGPEIRY